MVVAYRGFSVILFAPVAALMAVVLTDPKLVLPVYSGVFMDRMAGFIKLYFPVFLLGAIFGKLMEVSGFARSIIRTGSGLSAHPTRCVDRARMRPAYLRRCFAVCGGVRRISFAAELFRAAAIPKRFSPPRSL